MEKLLVDANVLARKLKVSCFEEIESAIPPVKEELIKHGLDESERAEILDLLRSSILCPGFRKGVAAIATKARDKKKDKAACNLDIDGICDATAIPSGLEIYNLHNSSRPTLVELSGDFKDIEDPHRNSKYVYAYNLPKTASEKLVREALSNVGNPRSVFIYETGAAKVPTPRTYVAQEVSLRNSPVNAVIEFEDQDAYDKVTTIEAKLFGILCEGEDREVDSARMMYLEAASVKRYLILSGFKKSTRVSDIQEMLAIQGKQAGLGDSIKFTPSLIDSVDSKHHLSIKFPSFASAYAMLKQLKRSNPDTKVCFSMSRSKWSDSLEAYVDTALPALSD